MYLILIPYNIIAVVTKMEAFTKKKAIILSLNITGMN